jgi:hypothetical protein
MENGVDSLPSIDMNEVDMNDYYNNNNDMVDDVPLSGTVACGYSLLMFFLLTCVVASGHRCMHMMNFEMGPGGIS